MASPPLTPHQTPSAGDAPFTLALIVKRLNVLAAVLHEMEARVRNLERRCEASSTFEAAGLAASRNDAAAVTADPIAEDLAASAQSATSPSKAPTVVAAQYGENRFNGDVACHEHDNTSTTCVDVSDASKKGVCGKSGFYRDSSANDETSSRTTDMSSLQPCSAASRPQQPILPMTNLRRRFESALHPRQQFEVARSQPWAFNTEGLHLHVVGEEAQATIAESTVAMQTKVHGVVDGDIMDPIPPLKTFSHSKSFLSIDKLFAMANIKSTRQVEVL
eukprot:TRINITY_DN15140_c0_g1_i1.p1 TRINITY_DN15140_c0_g1~~TRINITY_DN15140_c0_g1_i1.p1  ORF type:complete len:276 (+),score=47.75 TRINITY_DN15140_c0_g1_i1:102-929(+)